MDWEPEPLSSISRTARVAAALAVGLLSSGCGAFARPDSSEQTLPPDQAEVRAVIDGDTIDLLIGGQVERVRLLGIDAPESVHPTVPVQCFGPEASALLSSLLPPETIVRVERDTELRDRFDRLLLYVYRLEDQLFVNRWLVESGLADTSFYEPNTALAGPLTEAKTEAKTAATGLWSSCDGPDQPRE